MLAAAFPPCSALLPWLASFNYSRPPLLALMMERTSTVQEKEQARGGAGGKRSGRGTEWWPAASRTRRREAMCGLLLSAGPPMGTAAPL